MTYAVEGSRLGPEVKWALTICSAVLFVDIAQPLWAQHGLQVWSAGCESLAMWAIVLAGFALFASLVPVPPGEAAEAGGLHAGAGRPGVWLPGAGRIRLDDSEENGAGQLGDCLGHGYTR
ncbi:hypothetical protein [Pseudomonas sp. NPDC089401]|uniref:hypothetical protein n=1 Tax=Pseudomonas sp. NPDC089401 TaxID=3364462 RepID=UPI0038007819